MLSSSLQSILDNRLRYLPEITAQAISSVDWASKLADIAREYGLHMDEVEDLQSVVMRSMVGMIQPAEFEQALISALALSPANAEKMIAEINGRVFQPIHDYVMNGGKSNDVMADTGIHVEGNTTEESAAVETAPQAATVEFETNELELPEVQKSAPVASMPIPPAPMHADIPAAPKAEEYSYDRFQELFFPTDSNEPVEDLFAKEAGSEVQ
ncbi:MAG: hypothetical protein JWM20_708 [Patescibacteria group bacterium]|nr:hypothetical protein [Patescibacteria group bacterium]